MAMSYLLQTLNQFYIDMIDKLTDWLADVLPDKCQFRIPICKLNPLYNQVMKKKLAKLGYGNTSKPER